MEAGRQPSLLVLLVVLCSLESSTGAATGWELVVVDLSDTGLTSIPSKYPQNITELILNKNLIQLSESDRVALASYPKLTELHLDNNLVNALPGKYFSGLTGLNKLHLSNNNISRVDPEAFSGLENLIELDLSKNLLMSLPEQLFSGLTNLEVLSLRANGLEVLSSSLNGLKKLSAVDLQENPWNCSCLLAQLIHQLNTRGVRIEGPRALCAAPEGQTGSSILEATSRCFPPPPPPPSSTTAQPPPPPPTTMLTSARPQANTQTQPTTHSTTRALTRSDSIFNKAQAPEAGDDTSGVPVVGNTWKFLVGVLVIALSTSMLIVFAIKSPSWYKLLFNYRHQRLRDDDEPNVFVTSGRYSNYSLDTQQTETSAYELETGMEEGEEEEEDDDGYIEDRYIETADYGAGGEYSTAATAEEQA